jgi:hypothetical protein
MVSQDHLALLVLLGHPAPYPVYQAGLQSEHQSTTSCNRAMATAIPTLLNPTNSQERSLENFEDSSLAASWLSTTSLENSAMIDSESPMPHLSFRKSLSLGGSQFWLPIPNLLFGVTGKSSSSNSIDISENPI